MGKKRNANITTSKEPVFILTHDFKINSKTSLLTSVGYTSGEKGREAIDWYNAADPYPDYYQYMPSYWIFNGNNDTNFISGSTVTAPNKYNLNVDNYVNMTIYNLPSQTQNANDLYCSFKIPLNSVNGTIYYSFCNSTYNQSIDNTDNNFILDKLLIKVTDRWGNIINNGSNYSFTLEIEYE